MVRQYKPSIPTTIGDLYVLLGFVVIKAPTFLDPVFPGRNLTAIFFELEQGLNAIRDQLGNERFDELCRMASTARAHFEADPDDSNGRTREGRKLVQEMEAIVLSAVKPPEYPTMGKDDMIALANRLRNIDGTPQELDAISDRLLVALPNAKVMALLFDDTNVSVEEAIDEAIRREKATAGS